MRLTDQQVQQLIMLFEQGQTIESLAEIFGVEKGKVLAITFGLARADVSGWSLKKTVERNKRLGRPTTMSPHFRKIISPAVFKEAGIRQFPKKPRKKRVKESE